MAQNVNTCGYGSFGGDNVCIMLTPQTIRQIQICVDDGLTNKGARQLSTIYMVIAIEIEEYDPVLTQIRRSMLWIAFKIRIRY